MIQPEIARAVVKRIGGLIISITLIGLCFFAFSVDATAQFSDGPLIEIGLAETDITPDEPVRLSGYGARATVSEGVAQRIRAKALAIGSDEEGPVVLITADVIGVPGDMVERVARKLEVEVGIPRSRLAVTVTHTHTGPTIKGAIPNIFSEDLPPDQLETIARYTGWLEDRLEQVALQALRAREPARLSWSQGEVSFAANRRVLEDGEWVGFGVNPDGPVDHNLPVMAVIAPDGSLRGVLVSYATHCTTLGADFNKIHGDWAGEAQAILESRHDGLIAMVAIGAGADTNPEPRLDLDHVAAHATAIADEVDRLLQEGNWHPLTGPPDARFERIELPFDPEHIPTRDEWKERAEGDGPAAYHARRFLERLDHGEQIPTTMSYPIQTWTFGTELAKVFLAGEVVVDYSLRLKRELDGQRLWINAYANDSASYIASERVIREGGYEVDASMYYYDRPARLSTEVEELIIETVRRMLPEHFRTAGDH